MCQFKIDTDFTHKSFIGQPSANSRALPGILYSLEFFNVLERVDVLPDNFQDLTKHFNMKNMLNKSLVIAEYFYALKSESGGKQQ